MIHRILITKPNTIAVLGNLMSEIQAEFFLNFDLRVMRSAISNHATYQVLFLQFWNTTLLFASKT